MGIYQLFEFIRQNDQSLLHHYLLLDFKIKGETYYFQVILQVVVVPTDQMKNKAIAEAVDMLGNFSFPEILFEDNESSEQNVGTNRWYKGLQTEKEEHELTVEATSGLWSRVILRVL